ncbi:uncharacterized protein [Garra rufa]|uniref:uncharacterized protein n=1 Tax=Garra rufa TaxID=137080 RepID=UPI003CCE963B
MVEPLGQQAEAESGIQRLEAETRDPPAMMLMETSRPVMIQWSEGELRGCQDTAEAMVRTGAEVVGEEALTSNISTSFSCEIAGSHIKTSTSVKNLGVIFDSTLSFQSHIKSITKSAFYHLRCIAQLRPFISNKDAETVVHAFVSSRIDFCNALFIGLPASSISRLQYIQNSAARILTHTKHSAHITPILYGLHWLPVAYRIKFKILLLAFKSINGLAPSYLCNILVLYIPIRSLRSSDSGLLAVPRYHLSSMGGRSFSVIAPKLWNSLPRSLRSVNNISEFKSLLKTHLFFECYTSNLIN